MRFLIIPLFCMACAGGPHEHIVQVDPAFNSEYTAFLADGAAVGAHQNVTDLIVTFGDPSVVGCTDANVGCCSTHDNQTPVITIRQSFWETATDEVRTLVMYHELGHCVLGRVHDQHTHPGGAYAWNPAIAASIMEAQYNGAYLEDSFTLYHDDYVKELFGLGPGPEPYGP